MNALLTVVAIMVNANVLKAGLEKTVPLKYVLMNAVDMVHVILLQIRVNAILDGVKMIAVRIAVSMIVIM
jgi:hypothetical protein